MGASQFIGQSTAATMLHFRLEGFLNRIPGLPHVLVSGPPSCGKSSLIRAAARAHGIAIHECQAGDLLCGEGGRPRSFELLLNETAAQHPLHAPAVIHMSGMEALPVSGDAGMLAQLSIESFLRKPNVKLNLVSGPQRLVPGIDVLFVGELIHMAGTRTPMGFGPARHEPAGSADPGHQLADGLKHRLLAIPCAGLTSAEILKVARMHDGPLAPALQALEANGIDARFAPGALERLATMAWARPDLGAAALPHVLIPLLQKAIENLPDGAMPERLDIIPAGADHLSFEFAATPAGRRNKSRRRFPSRRRAAGKIPVMTRTPRADRDSAVRLATAADLEGIVV